MDASRRLLTLLVLHVSPMVAATGCGYQLGYRSPPSVRTIAVPMFNNATFPLRRDVEYELTRALRREIQDRSGLRLVDARVADMSVFGTVVDFQERVVAESETDEPLESNLRITVDLVVEDYINGKSWKQKLRDVQPFSSAGGDPIAVARGRAITNLAEKILLAIESW